MVRQVKLDSNLAASVSSCVKPKRSVGVDLRRGKHGGAMPAGAPRFHFFRRIFSRGARSLW